MKKLILFTLLSLNILSAFAHAGECRLRRPVPIKDYILTPQASDKSARIFYKHGVVDHLPLGDYSGKERWRNGELEVRVHQVYTFTDSWNYTNTGYIGASVDGSNSLGVGLAEAYNGVPLAGQIIRQNGEASYTTIEEYGPIHRTSTIKFSGNYITSIELTVPVYKDVNGSSVRTGQADTICVLEIEPDFERLY